MKGQLFQLFDADDENAGLLYTPKEIEFGIDEKIKAEWMAYYSDNDDPSVEDFAKVLNEKFGADFEFERTYLSEINFYDN